MLQSDWLSWSYTISRKSAVAVDRLQNGDIFSFSRNFKFLKRWCFDFKNLKLLKKGVRTRKQLKISNDNSVRVTLLKREV